jgi:hypothetical protein
MRKGELEGLQGCRDQDSRLTIGMSGGFVDIPAFVDRAQRT